MGGETGRQADRQEQEEGKADGHTLAGKVDGQTVADKVDGQTVRAKQMGKRGRAYGRQAGRRGGYTDRSSR